MLNQTKTASFQTLSNSLFLDRVIIRRYRFRSVGNGRK